MRAMMTGYVLLVGTRPFQRGEGTPCLPVVRQREPRWCLAKAHGSWGGRCRRVLTRSQMVMLLLCYLLGIRSGKKTTRWTAKVCLKEERKWWAQGQCW